MDEKRWCELELIIEAATVPAQPAVNRRIGIHPADDPHPGIPEGYFLDGEEEVSVNFHGYTREEVENVLTESGVGRGEAVRALPPKGRKRYNEDEEPRLARIEYRWVVRAWHEGTATLATEEDT